MIAYVLGNGPSLNDVDFDFLIGKTTYACNRINLIYPQTKWRPTNYVHIESFAPDLPYIKENVDAGIQVWISEHYQELGSAPNLHYLKHCHHYANYDDRKSPDEWHLPMLCVFGGSVNAMMQLAFLHGYDEIVLLGCDLNYRDGKPSDMHPKYEHGQEQPAWYANRNALWGHLCAVNTIHRNKLNLKVWNATTGGELHLYERATLENLATRKRQEPAEYAPPFTHE